MNLDPKAICPHADATFERYFEALGYTLYWEGKMETGDRWYEICDPQVGCLCFQISMPAPPIDELIADLPYLIDGKPGIGPTNYWLACEDTAKLRELLRRVTVAEVS